MGWKCRKFSIFGTNLPKKRISNQQNNKNENHHLTPHIRINLGSKF